MEPKVIVALIIVFLLVVGVNGALYLLMRRGQSSQHIRMWQKAARRARNPWEEEEDMLEELSRSVAELTERGETRQEEAQDP